MPFGRKTTNPEGKALEGTRAKTGSPVRKLLQNPSSCAGTGKRIQRWRLIPERLVSDHESHLQLVSQLSY